MEKKVGGLTGVSTVSQLPRNTKQVYNVKGSKTKAGGHVPLEKGLCSGL